MENVNAIKNRSLIKYLLHIVLLLVSINVFAQADKVHKAWQSEKDKYEEVNRIIDVIGELDYQDPNTVVLYVKSKTTGKILLYHLIGLTQLKRFFFKDFQNMPAIFILMEKAESSPSLQTILQ